MPLHPNDLTLYCITARGRHGTPIALGDGEGLLVLGKHDADNEAENVMCWPAVTSVTCEAYAWDSPDDRGILADADYNGVDIYAPVTDLAHEAGISFDPDVVSPSDLLKQLRMIASGKTSPVDTFNFPPLGPTGEGDPPYPGRRGEAYWAPDEHTGYFVTHQGDRPAVAFRCHYPGGSSPCDQATADRFIEWAQKTQSRAAA